MSNRPLASIEIPPGTFVGDYEVDLVAKYPHIEFQFSEGERPQPTIVSFDRRDADLGSIDGDKNTPTVAIMTGIQTHLSRLHRETQKSSDS
jgi:hypothetical protein